MNTKRESRPIPRAVQRDHADDRSRDRRDGASGRREDLRAQAEDPFQILIATLLSARTQDATTHAASTRLFKRARTPRTMAKLSVQEIERLIYPVGFYRNKARHVKACCEMLVTRLRRPRAIDDGGAGDAAGCRPKDGEPGADPRVQEPAQHLRGHARASHLESSGLGADRRSRRDGAGALPSDPARWWPLINLYLVTWGQNVCRPCLSALRGLRDLWRLSKDWTIRCV